MSRRTVEEVRGRVRIVSQVRGRVRIVSRALTDGSKVYSVEIRELDSPRWYLFAEPTTEATASVCLDWAANALLAAAGVPWATRSARERNAAAGAA